MQVNPLGIAFSLIKRSDLIQVDHQGNVIGGGPCRLLNIAAFMIREYISKFDSVAFRDVSWKFLRILVNRM